MPRGTYRRTKILLVLVEHNFIPYVPCSLKMLSHHSVAYCCRSIASQDDDIFSEVDFGRENDFGDQNSLLGESASLFETDLRTQNAAVFSGVEFDEAGSLLKSRKVSPTSQYRQ